MSEKYRVVTDDGVYEVEVENGTADPSKGNGTLSALKTGVQMMLPGGIVANETAKNVGTSALNAATGIGSTLIHPTQTLQGIGSTVGEVLKMGIPGRSGYTPGDYPHLAAIGEHYSRYSPSRILETLTTDPVGAALDISMLLEPALAGAKALPALRGAVPALETMTNLSNPMRIAKSLTAAPREVLGTAMMSGAAKLPSVLGSTKKAKQIAQTAIREGTPATMKGIELARERAKSMTSGVTAEAKRVDALGAPYISSSDIAKGVDPLLAKQRPGAITSPKPIKEMTEVKAEYLGRGRPSQPVAETLEDYRVDNQNLRDQYLESLKGQALDPDKYAAAMAMNKARRQVMVDAANSVAGGSTLDSQLKLQRDLLTVADAFEPTVRHHSGSYFSPWQASAALRGSPQGVGYGIFKAASMPGIRSRAAIAISPLAKPGVMSRAATTATPFLSQAPDMLPGDWSIEALLKNLDPSKR